MMGSLSVRALSFGQRGGDDGHYDGGILDVTGVDVVDTATANHLLSMIRAVRLLGAEGILTGIRPSVAQTVVSLGLISPIS